jgi:hypothetical protein
MTTDLSVLAQPTEARAFLAVFSRLCVALREKDDDSGITQQVYFEALRDVPLKALEAGAATLMREQGRRFFPTTAEWRAAADRAMESQLRSAVGQGRTDPWQHECRDCEDTGWIRGLSCPGDGRCGRTRTHQAHDYTMACPCRATNRTYRRHLAFGGGAA